MNIETRGKEEIERSMAALKSAQSRRAHSAACGKAVEVELRRHFASRPSNKQGWRSSGFWRRRVRQATALTAWDEESATVTIAEPAIQQKIHGGTIKPREGKMLTIPARPEAYGRSPRTFGNLVFIPLNDFRQGKGAGKLVGLLVEKDEAKGFTRVKRKKGQGRGRGKTSLKVFYYCLAAVTQGPDRDALPSAERVDAVIWEATDKYFARLRARGGRGA